MSALSYSLKEIADLVGGEVRGDAAVEIRGVAGIKEASDGDITFVANPLYAEFVSTTCASAVIVPPDISLEKSGICIANPYYAYLQVLNLFAERLALSYPKGIHEAAAVHPEAILGDGVSVGPFCEVSRGARIGRGTTILAGTSIGVGATVGEHCILYSNVTVREGCELGNRVILQPGVVVGSDGFGFARDGKIQHKIPQIGCVVIEDDVEIGANSTVDRATTGETRIKQGVKIDNLVQIAHNVIIGANTVIASQTGISGSTQVGENVTMAGQVGIGGHLNIGNNVIAGGRSGITKDVADDMIISGYPARDHALSQKLIAHTSKLPEMLTRLRALEKQIKAIQEGVVGGSPTTDD